MTPDILGQNTEKKKRSPKIRKKGGNPKGNPQNLQPPWPKGVSPNPGGRPKMKPITDALRSILDHPYTGPGCLKKFKGYTNAQAIAAKQIEIAIQKGDTRAVVEITDRVEGKVPQQVTGRGGGAVEVSFTTPEENEAAITAILNEAFNGPDEEKGGK